MVGESTVLSVNLNGFIGGTLSKWMASKHVHAGGASVHSAYVCMGLCNDDTGMLSLLLDQI